MVNEGAGARFKEIHVSTFNSDARGCLGNNLETLREVLLVFLLNRYFVIILGSGRRAGIAMILENPNSWPGGKSHKYFQMKQAEE